MRGSVGESRADDNVRADVPVIVHSEKSAEAQPNEMALHDQDLKWLVRWPTGHPNAIDDNSDRSGAWLAELWTFRGNVLYERGLRPLFQSPDGRCTDPDRFDHQAYHIQAFLDNSLVGCLRIMPFALGRMLTESVFGDGVFARLMERFRCSRSETAEAGRWIVHSQVRGESIGLGLVAGGWALLRNLGFKLAVASVGTRFKQDEILRRIGLNDVPDSKVEMSLTYVDEIRPMYADITRPLPEFAPMIDRMAQVLRLSERDHHN
jgi:N-acyl-L-homoserine lactone synthetase